MVVSIAVMNLKIIAPLMVFIDRKLFQGLHRKMECARSMRLHVGLPLHMWAKAINTIVYLINRGPSTPLGCGILEEAWTSKKVSYSFLRTFGYEAFAHLDS